MTSEAPHKGAHRHPGAGANGDSHMYRHAAIVSIFLLGATVTPDAHAVGITTYGVGLKSCKSYLDARQVDNAGAVAFVDWLSGYFSAVNKTSHHRNNFFGLADLTGAMIRLDEYCSARPR